MYEIKIASYFSLFLFLSIFQSNGEWRQIDLDTDVQITNNNGAKDCPIDATFPGGGWNPGCIGKYGFGYSLYIIKNQIILL